MIGCIHACLHVCRCIRTCICICKIYVCVYIYIQVYDCWWTFNLTVTIQQHKQKKQLHKQLTTTDIESNNNKVVIFIQPTRIHNMTKVSMLIKQSRCTKKKHGHIKQAKCVLYTGNIWRCQSNFQTIVFGCANLQIHWFSPSKANHVHPFCGIWEVHLSHIARWACWKVWLQGFVPTQKNRDLASKHWCVLQTSWTFQTVS